MESKFFSQLIEALKLCIDGLPETLMLTFSSVIAGFMIAIILSIQRANKNSLGGRSVGMFTYVFTGTPLLVQLYIIYYGLPEFSWVQDLQEVKGFEFMKGGFFWAWLAFTLNTAAYSTEIFAGAIRNTPNGDIETATAYGMGRSQLMRHVVMPSSLRRALPAYSNEIIMMMHGTSLASLVTLMEVMGQTSSYYSRTYELFPAFTAAGIVYLSLTLIFVFCFRQLEKRYLSHLKRSAH
jgi:arginine/ornithine transport system permease protein